MKKTRGQGREERRREEGRWREEGEGEEGRGGLLDSFLGQSLQLQWDHMAHRPGAEIHPLHCMENRSIVAYVRQCTLTGQTAGDIQSIGSWLVALSDGHGWN